MELMAASEANEDSRPWQCVNEGTTSMEQQNNSYDSGPSVCFMADALTSGVPFSVITCAAVTSSRLYTGKCLLTGEAPDLARLITAEIRPGLSRPTPVCPENKGCLDGIDDGRENPHVKMRTSPPAFEFDVNGGGGGPN